MSQPESVKPTVSSPTKEAPPQSLRELPRPQREQREQEKRDWRSLRKPPEQIIASDTGHVYAKEYGKKKAEPKTFTGKLRKQGEFMADVGSFLFGTPKTGVQRVAGRPYDLKYSRLLPSVGEKRRGLGTFEADFGRTYGLSSFVPEARVVAPVSESELEWESQYREFKLWRMISTSNLSEAEKERLHIELFPWSEAGIMQAHAEAESHRFYQSLGYPQFGGKYAPFMVPVGAKIKSIIESGEGLRIEYETSFVSVAPTSGFWDVNRNIAVVEPTSGFRDQIVIPSVEKKVINEEWLSEQLYSVEVGTQLVITEKGPVFQSMRPLAPLAFLIAPAERFVYSLATTVRGQDFPSVSTPPETPTFFTDPGAVVREGKTAMAASMLGEIVLSETLGFGLGVGFEAVGKAVSPVFKLVQTSKSYIGARGSYFSFVNWLKNPEPFSEERVFYDVYSDTLKGKASTSKELLRGTDWLKTESDDFLEVIVGEAQDDSMTQFSKGLKFEKPKGGFTSRKLPMSSGIKIAGPSEEELYTRVFASASEKPFVTQGTSQVLIVLEKPVSKVVAGVSTKELSFAEMAPVPMLALWHGKAYPFMSPNARLREEETEQEFLSYPASFTGFALAKPLVQADLLQRSHAPVGLSGFEVVPRLKPTATTFTIPKMKPFGFSLLKPVLGLRFDQGTKFRVKQFLEGRQTQKESLAMRQSLRQMQKQVTVQSEKTVIRGKRKKKVKKRGFGWFSTEYPFPSPEEILRGFEMEVTI